MKRNKNNKKNKEKPTFSVPRHGLRVFVWDPQKELFIAFPGFSIDGFEAATLVGRGRGGGPGPAPRALGQRGCSRACASHMPRQRLRCGKKRPGAGDVHVGRGSEVYIEGDVLWKKRLLGEWLTRHTHLLGFRMACGPSFVGARQFS